MQPEWIIGIAAILILTLSILSKTRREARTRLPATRYAEPNALLIDEEAIRDLLRRGNKINAIKSYRIQAGTGLKEAKYAVEAIEQEMRQTRTSDFAESPKEDDEIVRTLLAGNRINAIKLYRQRTGVGLKEAKDAIDRMAQELKGAAVARNNQPERGLVDPDELQRLINAGQKIQAIKYYREATGVGLKEAKDAVERIAPGLKIESSASNNLSGGQGLVDPDELQRLILAGQKIQAIKYYRETTGVGLKEAKDAVDWLEHQTR